MFVNRAVQPANVLRKRDFSICHTRSPMATVLSLATIRSVCTVNTQSRSDRLVRPEGAPFLFGLHRELAVEYIDIAFAQELVSLFQRANAGQPKFLWQAPLPGSEVPLRTPASLWRIRRNHLHTQFLHRPSDLRQAMLVDRLAGLRSHKEMTSAIAIQRAE